jgi:hypothetical protein
MPEQRAARGCCFAQGIVVTRAEMIRLRMYFED